jgi:hypothetical protein
VLGSPSSIIDSAHLEMIAVVGIVHLEITAIFVGIFKSPLNNRKLGIDVGPHRPDEQDARGPGSTAPIPRDI